MTYHAKVITGGKIVIPAELRRELGIKDGDSLVFVRGDDGSVSIKTHHQVIADGQKQFRAMVGNDYSVDQFLREKSADWGEG